MLLKRVSFSRWRWLVLLAVHLCLLIIDGIPNSTGVLLIHWKHEFESSTAQLSVVLSIQLAAYHFSGAFSGAAIHKLGSRPVVIVCGALSVLGLILSSIAPSPVWLYLTAGLLAGSGFGGILNASTVCISQYFTKYYAIAQSLASAGSAVGIVILPPLTQYLSVEYGWRGAYLVLAGLAGNLLVFGMVLRPLSSFTEEHGPDGGGVGETTLRKNATATTVVGQEDCDIVNGSILDRAPLEVILGETTEKGTEIRMMDAEVKCDAEKSVEKGVGEEKYVENGESDDEENRNGDVFDDDAQCNSKSDPEEYERLDVRRRSRVQSIGGAIGFTILFQNHRFTLIVVLLFFGGACLAAIANHFVLSAVDRGVDEQSASFLMSFLGIGSIVARLMSAIVLGKKFIGPMKLFIISMWGSGISLMLMRVPRSFGWFVVVALSQGAFTGITVCTAPMVTRMCVGPAKLGRAFGVLMVFAGVGCLVGPVLAGVIYDATHSFDISFYTFGGLLTASGFALLFIGKIKQPEERKKKDGVVYRNVSGGSRPKLMSANHQNSAGKFILKTTTPDGVKLSNGDEGRKDSAPLKVVFDVGHEDETSNV